MAVQEKAIADLLGGARHVGRRVETSSDLVEASRKGLKASAMTRLATVLDLPTERIAAAAGVSPRTWARRRGKLLRPDESDRLIRVARVAAMASEVLGSGAKAKAWLSRPNRALAGKTPISLLDTDTGVRQVEAILGRIAHGVFS